VAPPLELRSCRSRSGQRGFRPCEAGDHQRFDRLGRRPPPRDGATRLFPWACRGRDSVSVKEHLRSQIDRIETGAELTPNEAELVRFAADRSNQLKELVDRSPAR
jgi:hypothetical protein